jgi:hypothetical protein
MVLALEREPRQRRQWARVVARSWDDVSFRRRLLTEPEAVLREAGIAVPPGIPVRVVTEDAAADADTGVCLRLPAKPPTDDLIEEDLGLAQAGVGPSAYLCVAHSRTHTCHTGNTGCRRSGE